VINIAEEIELDDSQMSIINRKIQTNRSEPQGTGDRTHSIHKVECNNDTFLCNYNKETRSVERKAELLYSIVISPTPTVNFNKNVKTPPTKSRSRKRKRHHTFSKVSKLCKTNKRRWE
jgi:hypothetical protein